MGDERTTDIDLRGRKVLLHDMCLRDGMHAKREQISVEQMVEVATALDDAGVQLIQVTHGGGLGGQFPATRFCFGQQRRISAGSCATDEAGYRVGTADPGAGYGA